MLYAQSIFWVMLAFFIYLTYLFIKSKEWKLFLKRNLFWIFVLALAVRIFVLGPVHIMYIDEPWYMEAAKNMIVSGEPVLCHLEQELVCTVYPKPIGWPFLISLLFIFVKDNIAVMLFSALIGSLSIYPLYGLASRIFNRKTAIIASLLLALNPLHAHWSRTAESFSAPVFFAIFSIYFALKYRSKDTSIMSELSIMSLFMAAFCRTEYILLLLIVLPILVFRKKIMFRPIALAVIGSAIWLPQYILMKRLQESIYTGSYFGAHFWHNIIDAFRIVTYGVNIILILVIAYGFFKLDWRRLVYIICAALLFIIFYSSFIRMQQRMLIPVILAVILLASYALARSSNQKGRLPIVASLLLIALINIPGLYSYFALDLDKYELETSLPSEVESDCTIVLEYPTVLASTRDLKVMPTKYYLSARPEGCYYYLYDGYCIRETISEPLGSQERCLDMLSLDLELRKIYRENEVEYRLYEIKQ